VKKLKSGIKPALPPSLTEGLYVYRYLKFQDSLLKLHMRATVASALSVVQLAVEKLQLYGMHAMAAQRVYCSWK